MNSDLDDLETGIDYVLQIFSNQLVFGTVVNYLGSYS